MKIEVKSSTIWALLLALLILFFVMPQQRTTRPRPESRQPADPTRRARSGLFTKTPEELDQEVLDAAQGPLDEYYARHPEERRPAEKEVVTHARHA